MPENQDEMKIKQMIDELVEKSQKSFQRIPKTRPKNSRQHNKSHVNGRTRTSHGISKNGGRRNRKRNI